LNVIELGDDDLNMSPDQLGFLRQASQIAPVADHHSSNVDLVSGSDIRRVSVEETNQTT